MHLYRPDPIPSNPFLRPHYAKKTGITHAQCWAHTRRLFFETQSAEPRASAEALDLSGALYQVETEIRAQEIEQGRAGGEACVIALLMHIYRPDPIPSS